MELDSRKESRRNSIMRFKSFDTQKMREIDRKEAGESRGFPIFGGNNRRCFPDGRKRMQSPGILENVKKKIHAKAKKML